MFPMSQQRPELTLQRHRFDMHYCLPSPRKHAIGFAMCFTQYIAADEFTTRRAENEAAVRYCP